MRYVDIAHQALAQMQPMMAHYPLGFGQWLQALAYALSQPREIAIVGDPDSADTQALLNVVRNGYRPFQVVALGAPDVQPASIHFFRIVVWWRGPQRPTSAAASLARHRSLIQEFYSPFWKRDDRTTARQQPGRR